MAILGCSDRKAPPPPLLGVKSEEVLAHLKTSCGGRVWQDEVDVKGNRSEWIECKLPDDRSYRVRFDRYNRIDEISISAPRSEAVQVFDRAIAPVVPDAVRETLRRSIGDPSTFTLNTKPGPCVDLIALGAGWKEDGASRHIAWHLDECVQRAPTKQ